MSADKKHARAGRIWSNNLYALRVLFGPAPVLGISIMIEAIRHNLINFLEQTICVFMVLDAIEHHRSIWIVVEVVALFLVLDFAAAFISNNYEQKVKLKYLPIAQQSLKNKLYEKAKDVDIANYDNPKFYNDYCMVISEADKAVERAEQLVRMIFGSITVLICYGVFFVTQDVVSVLFVLASFVLRTIFSNLENKLRYKLRLKEIPIVHKRDYIRRVFYLKDYAKELRLNKAVVKDYHRKFDEVQNELYDLQKGVALKRFLLKFTAKYLTSDFLLDIVYVLYLIIRAAVYRVISYSQVVVLYNSAAGLRRGFSMLTDLGPFAVETSLYMERIRTFLDCESTLANEGKQKLPEGPATLQCRNLSFGYDRNHLILENVNIQLNPGERVALVGYNGAGKSTLIKLILRLYDPMEGGIYLNGIDIREFDLKEYRDYIGVVFQDFQIYATTVEKNVAMDEGAPRDDRLMDALRASGFAGKLECLPNGADTQITKEFDDDGTELSGGEEQKLAVARTFYREAGLMLLDEPSSALDPIAEYELNCTMDHMAADRSVIYISHRLSTTRNADRIYVMQAGRIVEEGTHGELLIKQGIYAAMWNAQAGKYRPEMLTKN